MRRYWHGKRGDWMDVAMLIYNRMLVKKRQNPSLSFSEVAQWLRCGGWMVKMWWLRRRCDDSLVKMWWFSGEHVVAQWWTCSGSREDVMAHWWRCGGSLVQCTIRFRHHSNPACFTVILMRVRIIVQYCKFHVSKGRPPSESKKKKKKRWNKKKKDPDHTLRNTQNNIFATTSSLIYCGEKEAVSLIWKYKI